MIHKIDYKIKVMRDGVAYTGLQWKDDSPPDLIFNCDTAIKSRLSGNFIPNPDINFARDELAPVLIIDGEEYPLGVFRASRYGTSGDSLGMELYIEAYDRSWAVQGAKLEKVLFADTGTSYLTLIKKLLTLSGIALVIHDSSNAVMDAPREWDRGTDYLTVINELLYLIGFEPLWFDGSGIARLQKYKSPDAANICRNYSSVDIRRLPIAPEYSAQTDVFETPNVFICSCSTPDRDEILTATAVNDYALSPKSTINRQMRICKYISVNDIADQESLQAYANRQRDKSLLTADSISVSVEPAGDHKLGDVISIDHPVIGGIYREKGWRLVLKSGNLMTIDLQRTVL